MPIKFNFVGSSLTECILVEMFYIKTDGWKARGRERATCTFEENRRAVGMLNPMRDKDNKETYRGEERTISVCTGCSEDR